jgi:hypothetical protein
MLLLVSIAAKNWRADMGKALLGQVHMCICEGWSLVYASLLVTKTDV